MNAKQKNRRDLPDREVYLMENRLGAVLHGVNPRPDFVSGLHGRLVSENIRARNNQRVFQTVLFAIAGIISGILLIAAGIRAVQVLLSETDVGSQAVRKPVSQLGGAN